MPYIDVIEPEEAEGKLDQIYQELKEKRGKLAEVHKIQSLNPESIMLHMDLYMHLMFGKSPLKRYQREMIAVVVSAVNNCSYCRKHHAEALRQYWDDEELLEQMINDHHQAPLNSVDLKLCNLAEKLTLEPDQLNPGQHLEPLREEDLDDRTLLDATMIIAYFNFVNRIVLGLGVQTEPGEVKGYQYDVR